MRLSRGEQSRILLWDLRAMVDLPVLCSWAGASTKRARLTEGTDEIGRPAYQTSGFSDLYS